MAQSKVITNSIPVSLVSGDLNTVLQQELDVKRASGYDLIAACYVPATTVNAAHIRLFWVV